MKNMRNRKANRHKNYNYSSSGYCFVTICTKNSISLFGKIENNKMILNEYGEIVKERWLWLQDQYNYVKCGEYAIMPNHFHGILIIDTIVGEGRALPFKIGIMIRIIWRFVVYYSFLSISWSSISFFFFNFWFKIPIGAQMNRRWADVAPVITFRISSLNGVPFKTVDVQIITPPHISALKIIIKPDLNSLFFLVHNSIMLSSMTWSITP